MIHFTLKQTRKHISLQDCFKKYFNLPDDFPLQIVSMNQPLFLLRINKSHMKLIISLIVFQFNYRVRPLEDEALIRSALNVLLLVELYWFLNDVLIKPLQIATQKFAETHVNVESQVDLMTHMNKGEYPGSEDIDINAALDLEEVFGELMAQ